MTAQQVCPHHVSIAENLAVIRTNTEHLLAQNEAQWTRLDEMSEKIQDLEKAQARRNGEIAGVRWSAGILAGIISAVVSAAGLLAKLFWGKI